MDSIFHSTGLLQLVTFWLCAGGRSLKLLDGTLPVEYAHCKWPNHHSYNLLLVTPWLFGSHNQSNNRIIRISISKTLAILNRLYKVQNLIDQIDRRYEDVEERGVQRKKHKTGQHGEWKLYPIGKRSKISRKDNYMQIYLGLVSPLGEPFIRSYYYNDKPVQHEQWT